jgi:hypothetical protein
MVALNCAELRCGKPTAQGGERLAMLHTPEGSPLPPNVSAELQGTGDRVRGKGESPWSSLLPVAVKPL